MHSPRPTPLVQVEREDYQAGPRQSSHKPSTTGLTAHMSH